MLTEVQRQNHAKAVAKFGKKIIRLPKTRIVYYCVTDQREFETLKEAAAHANIKTTRRLRMAAENNKECGHVENNGHKVALSWTIKEKTSAQRTFNSIGDAARFIAGYLSHDELTTRRSISACVNGHQTTAYGYRWKVAEDE